MDVFRSESASSVFFELILGRTAPKQIADALHVSPPSVVEQLRNLQEAEIVKLGQKDGKFQHYDIDWKKLAQATISRAYNLTTTIVMANLSDDEKLSKRLEYLKRDIAESEEFHVFLKTYFSYVAQIWQKTDVDLIMNAFDTISNAIKVLEESLIMLFPSIDQSRTQNKLYQLLKSWYLVASLGVNFDQQPLIRALKSLDLM